MALKLDRIHVGRMLRRMSLAPDIVEAVLRGDEPDGISLKPLHDGVPLCWQGQREKRRVVSKRLFQNLEWA